MVHCRHRIWFSPLLISIALLLVSCTTVPAAGPSGPPPNVSLGPVLELLSVKTTTDHTYTILDTRGNAHVFIAAKGSKEVYHVVVSPDSTVQSERVESNTTPSNISATFESDGKLHLLLDDKHLVREESSWKVTHDTPWEKAGVKIHAPKFVQGSERLVWAFLVDGKEVGVHGRWEWFAFGGFGAGIVFPWHVSSQKLVIVLGTAMSESIWYVLDPQDNLDASSSMLTTDSNGNLHIVYNASLAQGSQPRYAEVQLIPPMSGVEHRLPGYTVNGKPLYSVSGKKLPMGLKVDVSPVAASMDPATSTVLVVRENDTSIVLTNGKWSSPLRLPLSTFYDPKLAPAGGDAFHAMTIAPETGWDAATRVLYLRYAQGGWSAPIELGQKNVPSIWGIDTNPTGIASNGRNRAFVVWSRETGVVGRWVVAAPEVAHSRPSPLFESSADYHGEERAIPEDLLNFNNGKTDTKG